MQAMQTNSNFKNLRKSVDSQNSIFFQSAYSRVNFRSKNNLIEMCRISNNSFKKFKFREVDNTYHRAINEVKILAFDFIADLSEYIIKREELNFFQKVYMHSELTAIRVKYVAKQLKYNILDLKLKDMDVNCYNLIVTYLQSSIEYNRNLTKTYGEGKGELDDLLTKASNDLSKYYDFFKEYNDLFRLPEPVKIV